MKETKQQHQPEILEALPCNIQHEMPSPREHPLWLIIILKRQTNKGCDCSPQTLTNVMLMVKW